MLSSDELILIGIIVSMLALILSNRLSVDVVALLVLLVLAFSGILTTEQALSGFSSKVVITLMGLFVITNALDETGITQWIAYRLNAVGRGSEARLIILFMGAGATLSLVMNNVAAAAILLPAAVRVSSISKVKLSKILMPMAFGTLVGGMMTYLTTANIIMSELLETQNQTGLGMLDFLKTGTFIMVGAIIYMLLIGRNLLPERESLTSATLRPDLKETYHLDERLWKLQVLPNSRLVNKTLKDSAIGETFGLTVLSIWHGRRHIINPTPNEVILEEDDLLLLGREERIRQLAEWGLEIEQGEVVLSPREMAMVDEYVEVIIPPRSSAIGQTLTQLRHRSRFGLTTVALWREGRSFRTDAGIMPLQVGDALLMAGSPEAIEHMVKDRDYLVTSHDEFAFGFHREKAALALIITNIVLFLAIFEIVAVPLAMLAGAVAMIITGTSTMERAYHAIEWHVIFLIAGMLPLSIAITQTGLAARIGESLVDLLSGYGPLALIAGMFLFAMLITQVIGGQVTGLIIGPIAITAALHIGVNAQAMAVAVAIGCSTGFLTPIAHPANVLMMGPAGYKPSDFFKVGLGMVLVTFIMLMINLVVVWGIS